MLFYAVVSQVWPQERLKKAKSYRTRRNGSPGEVLVKRQKARARGKAETTYSLPCGFPGKDEAGQLGQLGIGEFE